MCGRINVHDHGAVQALMNRLSVQIDPSRFVPRYNVAPGARSVVAHGVSRSLKRRWRRVERPLLRFMGPRQILVGLHFAQSARGALKFLGQTCTAIQLVGWRGGGNY